MDFWSSVSLDPTFRLTLVCIDESTEEAYLGLVLVLVAPQVLLSQTAPRKDREH